MLGYPDVDLVANRLLQLGHCFKYKVKQVGKSKCWQLEVKTSKRIRIIFYTCSSSKTKKGRFKHVVIVARILYIEPKGRKRTVGVWALRNIEDVDMVLDYAYQIKNLWWPHLVKIPGEGEEVCPEE